MCILVFGLYQYFIAFGQYSSAWKLWNVGVKIKKEGKFGYYCVFGVT